MDIDVDATVAGTTSKLELPPSFVRIEHPNGEHVATLGSENGPITLPTEQYVVHIETNVRTKIRFDGRATVEKPNYEATTIRFPGQTAVTLGFESRLESPPETITVPPTPEGIAAAISALPAAHRTVTPDRSFPTMRGHPPLIELGETVDVPATVRERRHDPAVEFRLPPSRSRLFPAAPLAYYLGAKVTVSPGAAPTFRTSSTEHELPDGPEFERTVASLLRRVFLLDSLVRNAGPYGVKLDEMEHLDTLGLDADALYEASIPDRLNAYLSAPFDSVSAKLPEWHLSLSVDPVDANVPTLSHHLHRLANIVLPKAEPLPREERLSRSLDDFYRGGPDRRLHADGGAAVGECRDETQSSTERREEPTDPERRPTDSYRGGRTLGARRADESVSVEMLKPELGPGRTHGWLADGAPIDAYRSLPEAYEHRFDYRDRAGEPFSFVAVLNDTGMAAEHTRAAEIYRERADELDIDITVHESLDRERLADVFESRNDLVHYIGHCDRAGLRCPDGHLSASTLSESNAQVFFLNACGSYYEGLELVRKGSVAGAVTFNRVLDQQAASVGTTFARLLVGGFSIARAMRISRRQIMMGKDYTVVGDGTHVLTQANGFIPIAAKLTETDAGTYQFKFRSLFPYANGGHLQPHVPAHDRWYLFGSDPELELDEEDLFGLLDHADLPIVYDGDIHWPETLPAALD